MTAMSLAGLNLPGGRELTADDLDRIPWRHAKFELFDGQLVVTSPCRGFVSDDLDEVPDDGYTYEVIEGALFVSAAPSTLHQRVVWSLARVLDTAVPVGLEPFTAPYEVYLDDATRMQPDVVVADPSSIESRGIRGAPLLAIDVLSPSSRFKDTSAKMDALEEAGCPHYWVIDPEEPSVLAWDLVDGAYVTAGRAVGHESLALERPFAITITPAALLRR